MKDKSDNSQISQQISQSKQTPQATEPSELSELDWLRLKSASLEMTLAEKNYTDSVRACLAITEDLKVKYNLGPADQVDGKSCRIIRGGQP